MPHVDVTVGILDYPIYPASSLYFPELTYPLPLVIGSYRVGQNYVFPVFEICNAVFIVPGGYGGYVDLMLSSSGPVNVSVYYYGSSGVELVSSAVNATGFQARIPQPEDAYFFIARNFLEETFFPAPLMTPTTLPFFFVVIEGENVWVVAGGSTFGAQLVQNPYYVFSWAILFFSCVMIALSLIGMFVSRGSLEEFLVERRSYAGLKLFFREPVLVLLPFMLSLTLILYFAVEDFWALLRVAWQFSKVSFTVFSETASPLPLYVMLALIFGGFIVIFPIVFLARLTVHYSVGKVYLEATGEARDGSSPGTLILRGGLLSATLFLINYLFLKRVEQVYSYSDLYAVGELALILLALSIMIMLVLYSALPRLISLATGIGEGDAVPKTFILRMIFEDMFFLAIAFGLAACTLYVLNPFAYPLGIFYFFFTKGSLTVLIFSGAFLVAVPLAFSLAIPAAIQTSRYIVTKLEGVKPPEGEEIKKMEYLIVYGVVGFFMLKFGSF
ncbi:MAG: hypothetical protein QXW47_03230 [Candidatus Jordarchaeales archaeon]